MRPPMPVPRIVLRSTPASAANLRTIGVMYVSVGIALETFGDVVEATGAALTGAA